MNNLVWKFNRLRTMGLSEIGYRIRQVIQFKAESLTVKWSRQPSAPELPHKGKPWLDSFPTCMDSKLYCAAADRVLAGYFDVFSQHNTQLGFPPQWNCDPKTGKQAPLIFGKTLNYRDERIVGDIKYLWEPNRHLQLITLAQAYHLSGDNTYANGIQTLLESWFDQCPYPLGVNWTSSLELAIRLVNWSFAWHLLGGESSALFASSNGQRFKRRWLDNIYRHNHFIAGHFSRYSSANNHLFGELTGLFVAAITWPYWRESKGWLQQAKDELEIESIRQNASDGVNREQAVYYQHEVIDMMLICWVVGRANSINFSQQFVDRLEKMLEFIASIMDVSGNVPMMGDADDALLVHWSKEPDCNIYRSLLATGAIIFNRSDFKAKAIHFDDKSYWLLGDTAKRQFDAISGDEKPICRQAFHDGGYFIMGDRLDSTDEVRIVIDAGPLGYLSIAAHGHSDALSFTLSAAGQAILIDPGTYAYHTQKNWRDYFRGTSAHNTVRVDGLDQSVPGGNFMWLHKANARCSVWENSQSKDCFIGSHDGYARLADPLIHHRKIEFIKDESVVIVEDMLTCDKGHDIEFNWHFAEACEVLIDGLKVLVALENVRLEMTMPESNGKPELALGRDTPPLGWISYRFDEKIPSPTVTWREKIIGTTKRITMIRVIISQ